MKAYFINVPVKDRRIKNPLVTKYDLVKVKAENVIYDDYTPEAQSALNVAIRMVPNHDSDKTAYLVGIAEHISLEI